MWKTPLTDEMRRTRNSWRAMRSRCMNPHDVSFCRYGARGVTVCDEWRRFAAFLMDMGVRPAGKTIDRVDGSKGYCKANCRWATKEEQTLNRKLVPRRNSIVLELNGKRQGVPAWTRELNLGTNTISRRLASGWPLELALTAPGHKALGIIRKSRKTGAAA